MKKFIFAVVLTCIVSTLAFADIPRMETPKPEKNTAKSVDSYMVIRLSDVKEAKLVLPKMKLKQLRAALDEMDDNSAASETLASSTGSFSRSQTIISGLFMSLALVFGGVWFARSRKTDTKVSKKIAAGLVLFFVGSMATLVYANAGPPSILRTINGKLFDKKVFGGWSSASGNIKIELSEGETPVELIVPYGDDAKTKNEE